MQALTAIGASIVLGCWLHLWYIKVWYPEYEGAHYVHNVITVDSHYVPENYPPLQYPSMWYSRMHEISSELSSVDNLDKLYRVVYIRQRISPPLRYWDEVLNQCQEWTVQNGKHLALVA